MKNNKQLKNLNSYLANTDFDFDPLSRYVVKAIDSGANTEDLRRIFIEYASSLETRMHDPTYG